MYRILMIDDEKLVIKSLINTVDWQEYGYEVVGEAYNGQEGVELIKEKRPDLVFIDIRMPGMSGLEVMSEIQRLGIGTIFAVVSGYAEFAYAQKAIKNGAISYCLKPFDKSEIVECLRIATEKLETQSEVYKIQLMMMLEEPLDTGNEKLGKILRKLKLAKEIEEGIFVAVVIENDSTDVDYPKYIQTMRLGINKQALFIPKDKLNNFMLNNVPDFYDKYVSIGISNQVSSIKKLKYAIDEASDAAWNYFVVGKSSVIFRAGDVSHDEADKLLSKIEKYNYGQDHNKLLETIDLLEELIKKGKVAPLQIVRLYNYLKDYLPSVEFEENYDDDYILNVEQLSYIYQNAKELTESIKTAIDEKIDRCEVKTDKIKNITAKQILEYVNKHFADDIAIRKISQIFFINPSYLSQLFKKEVGETFTKYLMKLRIQYACELLSTTQMNISEVAEKAGYTDYFYFARVFKKTVGKTPSQYRNEKI